MIEFEIVGVKPDTDNGRPVRHIERQETDDFNQVIAHVDREIRRLTQSGSLRKHVVSEGPISAAFAYTDAAGILAYANVALVVGE
ncbi:hypothetical protein DAISY_99 [Mycobacterium phage Daisy]|uniref:Uncharacterized protein n=2 Tax=Pipefishvirus TaxID=1982899 RepID=V5RBN6_9CAUD|nr:hypothetical protein X818_gp097 [Mycobacterium phage Bernardo]YP_009011330.1 hypothetical protein CM02_gp099 [Mycobacterium phage Gadjet]AEJ94769.1 hypothetical protein DAISY_99 [Mycobacterium phage Daisy]QDK01733.1 hypothetical protein RITA1961_101 [Mycobacterium phage Rita1961]QYW01206.1 hypothetical protein SEA_YINZ_98 [Mycobacterium phage Yinz]WGH20978.1 hypothetical protein SEA_MMASICARM_101 [Mycobacterium phage MmasiCarm]AER47422.1 hypothetical protein GADJET_99 [Mycobacterium phage 